MTKELVSICIPTYNSGKYVKRTLDSVLGQSYSNLEVIIVDDCSKDDTKEVIAQYKDPRIKFYENDNNLGLTGNWNKSLEMATGDFIKLLCADDIIYPSCIEEEVEAFTKYPQISMVIGNTHIVNTDDKITHNQRKLSREGLYNGLSLAKRALVTKNFYGAPCSGLFRKSTINKIGGYDEDLPTIPDYDMWIRLCYEGDVYFIDKYLSAFRIHNVSNTNKIISGRRKEFIDEHKLLFRKHRGYGRVKLTDFDEKRFLATRAVRNYMLGIFIKYFNSRR